MHIEELKIQIAEREKAEAEVRKLASGLEAKIRRLVEANVVGKDDQRSGTTTYAG